MEAQSEYVRVAYTFLHVLVSICMLSRCLVTKILRRSSVESLPRVRCRLGPFLSPKNLSPHTSLAGLELRSHKPRDKDKGGR